jgi:tripartite ATP-independent transporter DctM subunit
MLAGFYAVYVAATAYLRPGVAPSLPAEIRDIPLRALTRRVLLVMLPPLLLIFVVLGSIFLGVATPTEAGALGAVGAMAIAACSRRLTREALRATVDSTTRLTTMVVFLLLGSTAFALVFRGLYGDVWIEDILTNLPGGQLGAILIANLVIFLLGFFIDFFEIAFIVIPLLAPVFQKMGIDLVWFGVMVGMNLQTSFLTPPFGFALFYLRGVTPEGVRTTDIYKGVVPFIIIQVIGLTLIIVFPEIVTWLVPE